MPVVDINYTEVVVTDSMQGIASSDEILMGSAPSLSVNSSEAEVQAVTLSVGWPRPRIWIYLKKDMVIFQNLCKSV